MGAVRASERARDYPCDDEGKESLFTFSSV